MTETSDHTDSPPAFDAWARDLDNSVWRRWTAPTREERVAIVAEALATAYTRGQESAAPSATSSDCRSEAGITVGLVDSLISIARILVTRDLTAAAVKEALVDLSHDEDIHRIIAMSLSNEAAGILASQRATFESENAAAEARIAAAAVPAAQDAPRELLSHQLNLMAIRGWIDESFDEWAHTRSGPLRGRPLPPPNGYAGAAAAKVWQHVQEIVAAHPARQEPTDGE